MQFIIFSQLEKSQGYSFDFYFHPVCCVWQVQKCCDDVGKAGGTLLLRDVSPSE